jgi:diadenosine tetraphosphatase ApaH/serine/threonine PP2A family protein phosphatase
MAYTEEEIKAIKDEINSLDHEEMCRMWRYAPAGHIYFDEKLPFWECFEQRLFKHFGGFTPQISKTIDKNEGE